MLRGAVPLATWDRLFAHAKYFDRDLAPRTGKTDDLALCLHSWVVTVEAVTAPGPRGGVRRKTQDACGEGLAVDLAFEMADTAVALLPACALLDAERHRNAVTRLGACGQLTGDRAAAAQALNRYNAHWFANPQPGSAPSIAYLFHDQAEIEWPDQPRVRGGAAAALAWAGHMQQRRFWITRVIGETPDRVRIEGKVQQIADQRADWRSADAVQIWTRENGFDFRLRSLQVGAFTPTGD
ncbi:MAG: hypothetical protein EON57_06640 [Alphaproteobacteria bacterium]|nr:MAG: hypothetical protein EON57_06640 [Alphaproteobacteria bacterium]